MTPKRDKTRRCYPVEQVVVNERWWRRAFPLLQEWTGVAQSDIADVVYTGYAVGGGVDIFLVDNHAVIITVDFVIPVAEIDEDVCPTPE